MKRFVLIAFVLTFAGVSFGQRSGAGIRGSGGGGNTFGSVSGYGNVVFPGTGHAPGVNPNPLRMGGPTGSRVRGSRYGGYGVVGYPVYVGGYYGGYDLSGYGYSNGFNGFPQYPAQQEPNVTVVNAPPAAPAAPVIINQYFNSAAPAPVQESEDQPVRIYQHSKDPASMSAPAPETKTYLIAYKDHSVYSALAYWVEGHTLHYVTAQNTHNQSDLSLIDVDFTRKLNGESGIALPSI